MQGNNVKTCSSNVVDVKKTNQILKYLKKNGSVLVDKISKDNNVSVGKAFAICMNNDEIRMRRYKNTSEFRFLDFNELNCRIIECLKKNDTISLNDLCKILKERRSDILHICMNNTHIKRRELYGSNGRVTLFKYLEY